MKIEIDDNALIDAIVEKVVKRLTPLLVRDTKNAGDELMTVTEVAAYLKTKKSFIYDKIRTKQIPFRKIGKFPRFRKAQIDKWIENPYAFSPCAYKPLKGKGGDLI